MEELKIGVACAYLVREDQEALLRLQLDRFRKHTHVPYRIYATDVRLLPRFRAILEADLAVSLRDDVPPFHTQGPAEHSYFLDELLARGFQDGCTHMVCFDPDSFPVSDDWVEAMVAPLRQGKAITAIMRAENLDIDFPFPAGLMISREMWERHSPRFLVTPELRESDEFVAFLDRTDSPLDTGAGYRFWLEREGLEWHQLLRSNAHDDHFLLSGIYGDVIFHLGNGARWTVNWRGGPRKTSRVAGRASRFLHWLGAKDAGPLRRGFLALLVFQARFSRVLKRNLELQQELLGQLTADPDAYLAHLRGQDLPDSDREAAAC